ncbi:hypothetical protein [Flavobacterium lacus]|uniref:Uncharacterized protein n=1 Tax=Flavobacterium lacus TaxID=1353778 RepID=A0A328WY07_9FLAO|nr:hypothetical protein [Flavobacterium lacus]RAR48148.1 hypothetical protein B0I10_106151 [Flavobacterium lacus]
MRRKISMILILLFSTSFFINCNRKKYDEHNLYYLNFKDSLTINVEKISNHSKALVLNDSLVLYNFSELIYESHQPKWLFNNTKKVKILDDYVYCPEISEIEPPYKLSKSEKTNVFQVVKNKDTLLFYFETFDKVDFMFFY